MLNTCAVLFLWLKHNKTTNYAGEDKKLIAMKNLQCKNDNSFPIPSKQQRRKCHE